MSAQSGIKLLTGCILLMSGGTTSKIANNLNHRLLAIFLLVTISQSHYKSHYRNCDG